MVEAAGGGGAGVEGADVAGPGAGVAAVGGVEILGGGVGVGAAARGGGATPFGGPYWTIGRNAAWVVGGGGGGLTSFTPYMVVSKT